MVVRSVTNYMDTSFGAEYVFGKWWNIGLHYIATSWKCHLTLLWYRLACRAEHSPYSMREFRRGWEEINAVLLATRHRTPCPIMIFTPKWWFCVLSIWVGVLDFCRLSFFHFESILAPYVTDMSPTCRRHCQMSPNLGRHCVSLQHRRGPDYPIYINYSQQVQVSPNIRVL